MLTTEAPTRMTISQIVAKSAEARDFMLPGAEKVVENFATLEDNYVTLKTRMRLQDDSDQTSLTPSSSGDSVSLINPLLTGLKKAQQQYAEAIATVQKSLGLENANADTAQTVIDAIDRQIARYSPSRTPASIAG